LDDGDGVDGIFVGSGDGAVEVGLKVGILDGYDDGLSVAKIGHKFPGGSSISEITAHPIESPSVKGTVSHKLVYISMKLL